MATSPRNRAARATDDAGALHEEDPIEGNLVDEDDPIAQKRAASNRPARARVRPGGRDEDRTEARAAGAARAREAAEAERDEEDEEEAFKISTEFDGVTFVFDPGAFTIGYQLTAERGRPAVALLGVIGEETMEEILGWPVSKLQDLTQHLAKAAGLGN